MEIFQAIQIEGDTVYVFTEDWEYKIHLWCTEPEMSSFKFLGKDYDCIWLWYDKQDDIAEESTLKFNEK